jgi:hypothetical protein
VGKFIILVDLSVALGQVVSSVSVRKEGVLVPGGRLGGLSVQDKVVSVPAWAVAWCYAMLYAMLCYTML